MSPLALSQTSARRAIVLAVAAIFAACGAAASALQQAPPASPRPAAPAAPPQAAPGDLTILDDQGRPAGLCPLKHTAVSADITGYVARVKVRQQFRNPSRTPVEAVYTFPLPGDAAVDSMTMTIGDRVIRGEIKRRDEARRIYEAALAAGQSAALLDQERPNIFTQSVANLMPGRDVTIEIAYVQLLKYEEGSYEYVFPMVVGPRFMGAGSAGSGAPGNPVVVTDAQRISPSITPEGTRAGHDISLTVELDAGLPIREIKSTLHSIVEERLGPNRARIRLKSQQTIPNKDFILRYDVGGEQLRTSVLAHAPGSGSGTFTLIIQPPPRPPKQDVSPKEMVFVIDQTGSQRGLPIQKAKETIQFCLENLNPNDTFQVIGFNTDVFPCFQGPVPVTEENVRRAREFVAPLEGNGGTDILKSIDYALKIPVDPGRLRIICYMTDGYVGNDMQILDHVRKNRGQARVFVFGTGNSVNRFLIDGMAREGRGAAEYVTLSTPGAEIASRFYARVSHPLLLDPQVEFRGVEVADVYPKAVPDVFSSTPIILKGRFRRPGEGTIRLTGLFRGQPWEEAIPVQFPREKKDGEAISTLWAREKIEDLQSQDWLGQQQGSPNPKITEQIVNLALDYHLMTQHTSFVAVEERVVNVGGQQRRVEVPVEMPEGVSYDGIFGGDRLGLAVAPAATGGRQVGRISSLSLAPPGGGSVGGFRSSGALGGSAGGGGFGGAPAGPAFGRALARGGAPALQAVRGSQGPQGQSSAQGPRPPSVGAALKSSTPAAGPAPAARREAEIRGRSEAALPESLARDKSALRKDGLADRAAAPAKPVSLAERRVLRRKAVLAPALHGLAARVRKEGKNGTLVRAGGPELRGGSLIVQVWLGSGAPKDAAKKLAALGFLRSADLYPGRLLLGTLPVAQLERMADVAWVIRIEPPRFLPTGPAVRATRANPAGATRQGDRRL